MAANAPDSRQLYSVYRRLLHQHGAQNWWPGDTPFEIMVGAVLTQNTAWSNVEMAILNLRQAGALEPEVINRMPGRRLATLLKPSGYFNIKARRLQNFCRWYLDQGAWDALREWPTPDLRQGLLSVNGVGPETADDILLYAFERPVFVIDAYTRRLFGRLALLDVERSYDDARGFFEAALDSDVALFNEYHALIVVHGKDICRPRPRCGDCRLQSGCPTATAHQTDGR